MLDLRSILSPSDQTSEVPRALHRFGLLDTKEKNRENLKMLPKTIAGTVLALSEICRRWDPDTTRHQRRVGQIAVKIAREITLSASQTECVWVAGILHDLGKIAIPWEILSAPRKLTATEMFIIQAHAEAGYEILQPIEFPWPVSQVVRQHHERLDGSGYPLGCTGKDMLIESKILAVADVVEAMSSQRHYRDPLGIDKALEEITLNRGVLYGGRVVDACVRIHQVSCGARAGSNGDHSFDLGLPDLYNSGSVPGKDGRRGVTEGVVDCLQGVKVFTPRPPGNVSRLGKCGR